jgi:hypothetical protein
MKPLADWSPEALNKLYFEVLERLSDKDLNPRERDVFSQRKGAIYRLGTHEDMRAVWEKLLTREPKQIKYEVDGGLLAINPQNNIEQALVNGIQEVLWHTLGVELEKPRDRKIQLQEIADKVEELKSLINGSGVGLFEDSRVLENVLHKRNIEYRQGLGEDMGSQSFQGVTHIEGDAKSGLAFLRLDEDKPWMDRNLLQQLGWWTREALELNLTDILDYYSERMDGYAKIYKDNYGLIQPKLQRGLYAVMMRLYGSPLHDHVNSIASAILDDDSLATNKKYSKSK